MQTTGILPLNKPVDARSTQCVEIVRRILGRKVKVGHGGTLDSTASGLLVLLIGNATRLSSFVMDMPKCYETVVQLGSETTTDDASGEIVRSAVWNNVSEKEADMKLAGFMGWRMQSPPSVSAVHINGERAHALVRDGQDVEIPEKPVYFAKIERTSDITEDGKVSFRVHCRRGTYIRSFARDIGRALGCFAHVCALKRLSTGVLSVDNCKTTEELFSMNASDLRKEILSVTSLKETTAYYEADALTSEKISNGRGVALDSLHRTNFGRFTSASGGVTVTSEGLFSICRPAAAGKTLLLTPVVNIIYDRSN